jgi:hypothetical protein
VSWHAGNLEGRIDRDPLKKASSPFSPAAALIRRTTSGRVVVLEGRSARRSRQCAAQALERLLAIANGRGYFRADQIADSDGATSQALDDT